MAKLIQALSLFACALVRAAVNVVLHPVLSVRAIRKMRALREGEQ